MSNIPHPPSMYPTDPENYLTIFLSHSKVQTAGCVSDGLCDASACIPVGLLLASNAIINILI